MPQAIPYIAAAAAEAGAAGWVVGAIVATGVYLQQDAARNARRQARNAFNAGLVDRLQNLDSSVAPMDLVLGRVRKGGAVFYKASTGTNKTTFVALLALAGHEIDAVEQIYLGPDLLTLDGSGNVLTAPYAITRTLTGTDVGTGAPQTLAHTPIAGSLSAHLGAGGGEGAGSEAVEITSLGGASVQTTALATIQYQYLQTTYNAKFTIHLGGPGQVADPRVMALFPGVWTSAHVAAGVPYLFAELTYDETSFPSGLLPITAVVRGAKLFDPRTLATAWSENPALMQRHVYLHPNFGKATSVTAAEDARIATAADACDTATGYVVDGVTTTVARFRAGLVRPYGTPANAVLDDLAQAMGGAWVFARGELFTHAGVATASVMSLTEADLATVVRDGPRENFIPIEIDPHVEQVKKVNTYNVQIWDQGQDYKLSPLTPVAPPSLVARDGITLAQSIAFEAVFFAPQAQHCAAILLRDARDPLTVTLAFKARAYPLEIFDVVDLTIARFGWSAKLFQVLARTWTAEGSVALTLKETATSITDVDASFPAQGAAANTSLPNPWYLPPVTILSVTSGTDELQVLADGTIRTRMRVVWAPVDDASILADGGNVELQYRPVLSSGAWASRLAPGADSQALVLDVQDGVTYVIRARARNKLAVGDWGAQVVHQVLGKTELPPDVASLAINGDVLSWPGVTALDLAGYRLRAILGESLNWAGGFALHEGLVTSSPYTLTAALAGLYTYMVVAVDTSGNESATPAAITSTGQHLLAGNTWESWPQAPAFDGGTIANGTVTGGVLLADDSGGLFWGADTDRFWPADGAALFWPTASYLEMTYSFAIGPTADGLLVIDSAVAGAGVLVEMRRSDATVFWGDDAAAFWGADPDAFWPVNPNAWEAWPGQLQVRAGEFIELRITTSAGATQGAVTTFTPFVDVPTVLDYIDNAVIQAGGTRLTLTKAFRVIKTVLLTLQSDGGSAVNHIVLDKSTSGPLVETRDLANASVAGTVDANIKGY